MPGNEDQLDLKKKTIAIVGVGGTGCFVSSLLAGLGAKLILIDRDVIEERNLGRQVLFDNSRIGESKAKVASEKLGATPSFQDITYKNIDLKADMIIDCTDNTEIRLLLNDYCKKNNIPWIHTAAEGKNGQVMLITNNSPCYECVFQEKHGNYCEDSNILMQTLKAVSGIAAAIAADYLINKKEEHCLIRVDSETHCIEKIKVNKNPSCHACQGKYNYLSGNKSRSAKRLCGSNRYIIDAGKKLDLEEISTRLDGIIKKTREAIITSDFTIMSNGRVLIRAKNDVEARKKYARNIII